MDLIATATFGLEAIVARELEALGYSAKIIQAGRILFEGDETAVCRANLWLRTAERVLVRVGDFEALDFGTLFDATYAYRLYNGFNGSHWAPGRSVYVRAAVYF